MRRAMNTESTAITQPPQGAQAVALADIPAIRQFYMSVQRELWESHSIYIAPSAVAGLFLFGFLISAIHQRLSLASGSSQAELHNVIERPYDMVAVLIMGVSFVVAVFYCLDALYGERRDRSILFWKSLPVSDTTTVLSKMSIPLIVLPLITFAITVATHFGMLLLSSAVLPGSGIDAGTLWNHLPLFHMWLILFVHLLAGHGFWYAPIYGWLLLVSAWARRTPFLWAVLPPFALGAVEKIAFNTSYFTVILQHRMMGGPSDNMSTTGMSMDAMTPYTLGELLSSPGLWAGLAITVVFLAGAVRLRRCRGPI
jgi:ABC-2 type transport system permease protein